MLTLHILNVYVDKIQKHQFKFTFNASFERANKNCVFWSRVSYSQGDIDQINTACCLVIVDLISSSSQSKVDEDTRAKTRQTPS